MYKGGAPAVVAPQNPGKLLLAFIRCQLVTALRVGPTLPGWLPATSGVAAPAVYLTGSASLYKRHVSIGGSDVALVRFAVPLGILAPRVAAARKCCCSSLVTCRNALAATHNPPPA